MTPPAVPLATFADYLAYRDTLPSEERYELIHGALVPLPPESELNIWIADQLQFLLAIAQVVPRRLIKTHVCEVQVPVLAPGDAANRYPDLVVLRPEHLELTQRRLTITLEMPPPRLIVEVVSPGAANRERDYRYKRAQYAAIAVPEYWLVDPTAQTVTVLTLAAGTYPERAPLSLGESLTSVEFPTLQLAIAQLFQAE